MPKFIKKPVEIEAVQFKGSSSHVAAIRKWMETGEYVEPAITTRDITTFEVESNEGVLTAKNGDWIIKGVNGGFYPCSADTFNKTYTQAPETWLDRVKLEQAELQVKLNGLNKVMDLIYKPASISDQQWIYMTRQQFHMKMYNNILLDRIKDAENPTPDENAVFIGSESAI